MIQWLDVSRFWRPRSRDCESREHWGGMVGVLGQGATVGRRSQVARGDKAMELGI